MKKLLLSAACLLVFVASAMAQPPVQRVIYMIGDGMGLSQVYAGATVKGLSEFALFKAPYVGLITTYSANGYITDSAAGGTALATGKKTNNGMIGMTPDGEAVHSIMHLAKQEGKSTGIVVTVPITHATPAAFYGHNKSRKNQEELARDFLYSDIDFFVGGGKMFFEKRKDEVNLTDSLRLRHYEVVYSIEELRRAKGKKRGAFLAEIEMLPAQDRDNTMLPTATQAALDFLSQNKKGFFLMVEGSQIDYQGHNNDTESLVAEMLEFDAAVQVVIDYVNANPGTLLVVTADHETGGMVIESGSLENQTVKADFTTDYHTATPVLVFAYGAGAEQFTGVYDNTEIFGKMKALMKIQ